MSCIDYSLSKNPISFLPFQNCVCGFSVTTFSFKSCLVLPSLQLKYGFHHSFLSARKENLILQIISPGFEIWFCVLIWKNLFHYIKLKDMFWYWHFLWAEFCKWRKCLFSVSTRTCSFSVSQTHWWNWLWSEARILSPRSCSSSEWFLLNTAVRLRVPELWQLFCRVLAVPLQLTQLEEVRTLMSSHLPCDQSSTHSCSSVAFFPMYLVVSHNVTPNQLLLFFLLQRYQHDAGDMCGLLLPVVSINNVLPLHQGTVLM